MRKASPKIAWYVLISVGIVLILGACLKPVDVKPFPKEKLSGIGLDVEVEPLNDIPPELEANIAGILSPMAAEKTVSLGSGDTIMVTNADEYDAMEWYFDSTRLLTINQGVSGDREETLTVNTKVVPFNASGRYSLAVIGKKGDKRYSTLVYINVGS